MKVVLVDTSVWVNFFKGNPTDAAQYIQTIVANTRLATCPTIIQKILQGTTSDKDFLDAKTFMDELLPLIGEPYQLGIEAATIYRSLRKEGITIRKPNDCLIAAYAIKNKIPLLHDDKDFEFIASKSELETVRF
jgi:predicted nucleic acid-binding protein